MQTIKPLRLLTNKKADNTDIKQYDNSLFRLETNNTRKKQDQQRRGFQQAQGKTQNGIFGFKSAILGRDLERGFYYLGYTKAVICWKHYFYNVFSKARLCWNKSGSWRQKQKFTKNCGLFANMQKGVFLLVLFGAFVFLLFVFLLSFWKSPKKANFRGFSSFVSPKRLSFKSFSSSYCVVFLFSFGLPFQNSIFISLLFVISPFWKKKTFFFCFFCLFLC